MAFKEIYKESLAKDLLNQLGNPTPQSEHLEIANKLLLRASTRCQLTFRKELTESEIRVLFWSSQGYSVQQTADLMGLKFSTIESYRKDIRRKLNCNNMAQAVYEGICFGYLEPKLKGNAE